MRRLEHPCRGGALAEEQYRSGLGLACEIALDVLVESGADEASLEASRRALKNALNGLDEQSATKLGRRFQDGVAALTAGGRYQGRQKLEGRLTTIESHVVKDYLKVQGVDAEIRRVADVTNPVFCVEVWVRPVHFSKAQELMKTLTESRGEMSICNECGEENPQGFQVCWNCHAEIG